jgi:hypothetical protein
MNSKRTVGYPDTMLHALICHVRLMNLCRVCLSPYHYEDYHTMKPTPDDNSSIYLAFIQAEYKKTSDRLSRSSSPEPEYIRTTSPVQEVIVVPSTTNISTPPTNTKVRNKNHNKGCKRCGYDSHTVDKCVAMKSSNGEVLRCKRCNRLGHGTYQCWSKRSNNGVFLCNHSVIIDGYRVRCSKASLTPSGTCSLHTK